ncbi:MAG: ThuA domain-containing protein [Firmicutes bacterium]|nr:ThuA domain-containing protein [Bacillota bacterium]
MSKALIVSGGWSGHHPIVVGQLLGEFLEAEGVKVEHVYALEELAVPARLQVDLIVMNWTMGQISSEALDHLLTAVHEGTGLAGLHGGMADAFRDQPAYQFMVGGQWVEHPGGDGMAYRVHIVDRDSPIMAGISDFDVVTEQYYLHIDPAIHVLATTTFPQCEMPVAWTTRYGAGRVFYCALGHHPDIVRMPPVATLMARGMRWAMRVPRRSAN